MFKIVYNFIHYRYTGAFRQIVLLVDRILGRFITHYPAATKTYFANKLFSLLGFLMFLGK